MVRDLHYLFLIIGCCQMNRPVFCALEIFDTVAEWEYSFTEFPASGINSSYIVCFTANIASQYQHIITDESEFVVLGKLSIRFQIMPG